MPALDQFKQILSREQASQSKERSDKEQKRQNALAAAKTELEQLQSTLENKKNEAAPLKEVRRGGVKKRSGIQEEGREVVKAAKEAGKFELLRQNGQEIFKDNIEELKKINSVDKELSTSLASQSRYQSEIARQVREQEANLMTLENQPLTERIAEREEEYGQVVSEFQANRLGYRAASDEKGDLGFWQHKEGEKVLATRGDGYGSTLASHDYRSQHREDAEFQEGYKKNRLPINKALDEVADTLEPRVLTSLRARDEKNYERFEDKLLLLTSPQEEKKLLEDLKRDYRLTPEQVKPVRDLVARYEKLQQDTERLASENSKIYAQLNEYQEKKKEAERKQDDLKRRVETAQKELRQEQETLKNQTERLPGVDRAQVDLTHEINELTTELKKQEDDFLEAAAAFKSKLTIELADYAVASGLKAEPINAPGRNSLAGMGEALRGQIHLLNQLKEDKNKEISTIEDKKMVFGRTGKISEIQFKIGYIDQEVSNIQNFINNESISASKKYQTTGERCKAKEQKLEDTKIDLKYLNESLRNAPSLMRGLEAKLAKLQEEYLEARALVAAKFDQPV